MKAFTAVVNPTAGRGAGAAVAADLVARMPHGAVEVVHSRDQEHARELAGLACAQGRTVLAVGGDGLAGCVAGAVVAAGGELGLVAAGRGNDFARQLGLPTDPDALAEVFRAGRTRTVDVLDCGGRIVLGSVYAGVDSAANAIVNARPRVPASLVYQYGAVRALLTFRPAGFRLDLDGQGWAARGYSVVVANSGYYGSGMHIVPTAEVDDGLLDVLLIGDTSRWGLLGAMRDVYSGTHVRRPGIEVRQAREVELVIDRPVPVYGDGEPMPAPPDGQPIRVSVRPAALRVLV